MAKRKRTFKNSEFIKEQENPRLALMAQELGIAGMQVLVEYFSFDETQAGMWLDMMIERAKQNRAAYTAGAVAAHLVNDKPESALGFPEVTDKEGKRHVSLG